MPEAAAPDTGTTTGEPTAPSTPATPDTGTATPTVESLLKQLEESNANADKWKAMARDHETKGKRTAKEFDDFKAQHQTAEQKAVDDAKKAARTEALTEVGSRLVDAEVRVAAAGRSVDVDALLEGLDRSRFLNDDGEPKRDDITAWIDKVAPKPQEGDGKTTTTPKVPDLGQGRGGGGQGLQDNPLLQALTEKVPPRQQ